MVRGKKQHGVLGLVVTLNNNEHAFHGADIQNMLLPKGHLSLRLELSSGRISIDDSSWLHTATGIVEFICDSGAAIAQHHLFFTAVCPSWAIMDVVVNIGLDGQPYRARACCRTFHCGE